MSTPPTPIEHANALVSYLKPEMLAALIPLLETMVSPLERSLAAAPWDDELPSEAEERTAAESVRWLETHKGIPHEQVLADLGLTPEKWEPIGKVPLESEVNVAG